MDYDIRYTPVIPNGNEQLAVMVALWDNNQLRAAHEVLLKRQQSLAAFTQGDEAFVSELRIAIERVEIAATEMLKRGIY